MQKQARSFEVRAAGDDFALVGRAVKYNSVSSNELMPGVREMIAPGAFSAHLATKPDVVCLFNHNIRGSLPLGRLSSGTLTLSDSADGLSFRCVLDKNNTQHKDVYASVKRGDIKECSFSFAPTDETQETGEYNGEQCSVRVIRAAQIYDVSVVTDPFYGQGDTNVAARAAADASWSAFLKRILDMPSDWKRSERIHAAGLAVAAGQRSDDDDNEVDDGSDYTDEMQEAIGERFGSTRSGAHPAHFLVRYDATRCYTRHLDSDTRCRMTYKRDDTDKSYSFGECEPDSDYEPDQRSQAALDDERLRIRMANAAGRSK